MYPIFDYPNILLVIQIVRISWCIFSHPQHPRIESESPWNWIAPPGNLDVKDQRAKGKVGLRRFEQQSWFNFIPIYKSYTFFFVDFGRYLIEMLMDFVGYNSPPIRYLDNFVYIYIHMCIYICLCLKSGYTQPVDLGLPCLERNPCGSTWPSTLDG